MYYEINVSLNGQHYFATAPRSITDSEKFKTVLEKLSEKFPAEEGYSLSATYYPQSGKIIDVNALLTGHNYEAVCKRERKTFFAENLTAANEWVKSHYDNSKEWKVNKLELW